MLSRSSVLLRPPPTSARHFTVSQVRWLSVSMLPGTTSWRSVVCVCRRRDGSLQFQGHPSDHSTPPAPGGSLAPAPSSLVPSMAFAHWGWARLLLVRAGTDRRDDAAGFTSCCGLVSCSAPLRTRSLDHARELCYRGPWRLPGPDSHRLAALSLWIGYVITTSLLSWRPIFWTHPQYAGKVGHSGSRFTRTRRVVPATG
jgi:hypothetical protein